jgi:hypothetical protein
MTFGLWVGAKRRMVPPVVGLFMLLLQTLSCTMGTHYGQLLVTKGSAAYRKTDMA